ncbi:MAG: ThuA domain-containing protein [Balneolaceae bacterium]|nr:ThuA domain-containing protein [Balneolaceae bacterium]
MTKNKLRFKSILQPVFIFIFLMASTLFFTNCEEITEERHILFIAGAPSHGFGNHEHYGGSTLLAATIEEADAGARTTVISGWPEDESIFDDVDAVVIYSNGGPGHPIMDHLDSFQEVMDRGVGFVTLHYAVEVPPGEAGDLFLEWQGGYFETHWSVNPFWTANFTEYPPHPISNGVEPFQIRDEWYYHMRFADEMAGVSPILTDLPPAESLDRDDGPHSNNPYVREAVLENQEDQHVAWAFERPNGGRSFGFTGGHYHWNWGHNQFRRVVANAIVWTAGLEVPENGLQFSSITALQLAELTDDPIPDDWDHQEIQDMLDEANN